MGRRLPLPFLISLILHALLAMLGAFYMVQRHIIERDMVAVDITRVVESPPKRRLSKRAIKPVRYQPKIATVEIKQNRVPQRIQTAIELPATSYTTGVVAATQTPSLLASKDIYTISNPLSIEYKPVPLKMQPPQVSPKRANSTMASTIQLSTAPPNLDIDPTDFLVADLRDVTQRPMVINPVEPTYPDLARRAQREGVVLLEATIGIEGKATDILVVNSLGFGCDQAAVQALRSTRFRPARQGKTKVSVRVQLPYRFQLQN